MLKSYRCLFEFRQSDKYTAQRPSDAFPTPESLEIVPPQYTVKHILGLGVVPFTSPGLLAFADEHQSPTNQHTAQVTATAHEVGSSIGMAAIDSRWFAIVDFGKVLLFHLCQSNCAARQA